jgi:hypothetical protein
MVIGATVVFPPEVAVRVAELTAETEAGGVYEMLGPDVALMVPAPLKVQLTAAVASVAAKLTALPPALSSMTAGAMVNVPARSDGASPPLMPAPLQAATPMATRIEKQVRVAACMRSPRWSRGGELVAQSRYTTTMKHNFHCAVNHP